MRLFSSQGIWTTSRPTQLQPLLMPGCPVVHMMTFPGPLQSRQVFIASSKLSVPQLVTFPTLFSSPWNKVAAMRTTSFSMTLRELNMMGLSALWCRYLTKHASVTSLCALECSQTQAKVLPSVGLMSAFTRLSRILKISSLESPFYGRRSQVSLTCFLMSASSAFLVDSSYRYFSFLLRMKPILSASRNNNFVRQLTRPTLPRDSMLRALRISRITTIKTMICSAMRKGPSAFAQLDISDITSFIYIW